MKINYIVSTIKSFQKRESRLFLAFLRSEFNNTNANFIPFYNHLLDKSENTRILLLKMTLKLLACELL